MPEKCDTDEILKQINVLTGLKQVRDNMGAGPFGDKLPELSGLGDKLDTMIEEAEAALQAKVEECGNLDMEELPAEVTGGP